MILKQYTTGNGYACSCCRDEWDGSEWIEKPEMAGLRQVYDWAVEADPDGYCTVRYESDGILLLGFEASISKRSTTSYVLFGGDANREPAQKHCVRCDDGSKPVIDFRELQHKYDGYLLETEGGE